MDRGAWWATVHGVRDSDMTKWLTHTHIWPDSDLLRDLRLDVPSFAVPFLSIRSSTALSLPAWLSTWSSHVVLLISLLWTVPSLTCRHLHTMDHVLVFTSLPKQLKPQSPFPLVLSFQWIARSFPPVPFAPPTWSPLLLNKYNWLLCTFLQAAVKMKVIVAQSCWTLCNPMDCSPPGSSVHGILQARILEWVAISFPRGSSQQRDQTWVSWIAGRFFTIWATGEASRLLSGAERKTVTQLQILVPITWYQFSLVFSSLWRQIFAFPGQLSPLYQKSLLKSQPCFSSMEDPLTLLLTLFSHQMISPPLQ